MNPFEQLRADDTVPADPDPRFAARLRAEIEASLSPEITLTARKVHATMTDQTSTTTSTTTGAAGTAAPAGQIVTPYLAVDDAAAALEWYAAALGATELMRYTGDDGRVGHAEIVMHGAHLYLSDAYPEIGVVAASAQEGSSMALHLDVQNVDHVFDRAVGAGATSQREPADQTHGSRTATILDPYGHRWMLSTQIATPTIEEIDAAEPGFAITGASGEGSSVQPIQLGYFTIRTDDIGRAAAFYSAVFGWNVDPVNGHVDNCDLPFGFENQYYEGANLWMKVRDPEPVLARIVELGGEIVEDSNSPSGRAIECRDDQGRRFDLHEPAPGYG
jgi:uncharacterized glyoxalase superfamily protein PhnB